MASSMSECFICKNSLDEGEVSVVKRKGINRFKDSSVKRGKHASVLLLQNFQEITVHSACQKMYNDEKMILAYVHRGGVAPKPTAKKKTRSQGLSFDFKNNCLFCGEKITDEFLEKQKKLPISRRNVVRNVEKLDIDEGIVTAGKKRGDEWGQKVVDRIQQVKHHDTDLVAVDARYHFLCQQKFYTKPTTTGEKRGYHPATNVDEAMEVIYTYLFDNCYKCQFSLHHLIDQIEGEYRPDERTVKSRLQAKYGEDIIIADSPNIGCIVCFRNVGQKILSDQWYQNRSANPREERLRVIKTAGTIILEDIHSTIFSTAEYPLTERFLDNVDSVIPESLLLLLHTIILANKRGSLDSWKKKMHCTSACYHSCCEAKIFSILTSECIFTENSHQNI